MKAFGAGLMAVGLVCIALAGGARLSVGRAAPHAADQLDVEIAIDGTKSMASAIADAKKNGVAVTDGLLSLLPDTRFAVVVFRDHGNPAGEYALLQPFTSDRDKVKSGLSKITASSNPDPDNGLAESYNLAFRRSYSDPEMGWRPSARKIVLVLGDAEPNGAGTDRFAGCRDHSRDPENLSTARELANMRAAARTLIMVRELSSELSVSLQCYRSLAAGGYVGGVAGDAGSNLVSTMVELVQGAVAPLALEPDLSTVLPGNRIGYTLKLQNPNLLPVTVKSVTVVLPRGFRYLARTTTGMTRTEPTVSGRTLEWSLARVVREGQQARLHLSVRTSRRLGTYRTTAMGFVETATGNGLRPRTRVVLLRVKKRISAIAFRFQAGATGESTVSGRASARFRASAKAVSSTVAVGGSLLLRNEHGARVLLRAKNLVLQRLAGPTRARLTLRVVSARSLRGCRIGSSATLLLVYSPDLHADESSGSYLKLSLPRACGGTLRMPADITASNN
jgi:hypothetical protein